MRMTELINLQTANLGKDNLHLVEALVKTGPVMHDGYTYSGIINGSRHELRKSTQPAAGARPATAVDVPEGSYPGVDADQDALRGRAVALKASAVRILDLIDAALDTTAGKGGAAGIIAAMKTHQADAEGRPVDGIYALEAAIRTAEEAAAWLSVVVANRGEMPGQQDRPGTSPV